MITKILRIDYQMIAKLLIHSYIYIYIYTSRNTCCWLGSEKAFKNYILIYESYCFDIIERFGGGYPQTLIVRLRAKNHNIVYYTIEFNSCLSKSKYC